MEIETKRCEILRKLEDYHRKQGIVFMGKDYAIDYFRGLTDLIYLFWVDGKQDGLKEAKEFFKPYTFKR